MIGLHASETLTRMHSHSSGLIDSYWLHFQVFLQVTTNHVILLWFLKYYCNWRQLHELQLPERRRWSVYPSFSFQVLLLTILNTATTDGLMVQYQWAIIVEHLSYLFFYYRF